VPATTRVPAASKATTRSTTPRTPARRSLRPGSSGPDDTPS
jgi:hypothetical protein